MSLSTPEARAFVERLRDLLPARDAERVVREVESLVLDRAEAEAADGAGGAEAERRALAHLGTPEALADTLVSAPLSIGLSTRRAFARWLVVLVAGPLLLALLLTLAKADAAAVPGLLAPLPLSPWYAALTAVLGQVLLDVGLLLVLFALLGRLRGRQGVPSLQLTAPAWSRADALRGLLLLILLAVVAHPLRDAIFSVRRAGEAHPFLAPDLVALLPWLDVVLGLCALRCALVLAKKADGAAVLVVDALAGLGGVALLLLAATRSEVVRLPSDVLGADTAHVLNDLVTRAFLVVFVVAALLLTVRVVQRLLRLKRALAGA